MSQLGDRPTENTTPAQQTTYLGAPARLLASFALDASPAGCSVTTTGRWRQDGCSTV